MVDDIGIKLTGKVPGTQSRPTKLEIIQAINDAQDAICGEKNTYSFLQKTGSVNAWLPAIGTTTSILGGLITAPTKSNQSPGVDNYGNTTFIAEAFSHPPSTCSIIKSVTTNIFGTPQGFGLCNGVLNCYVVAPSKQDATDPNQDPNMPASVPNMNQILATATPITVQDNVMSINDLRSGYPLTIADGAVLPLIFNFDESVAIGSNQTVFIVISWTTGPLNGASFSWGSNPTEYSGNSYTWVGNNYPGTSFAEAEGTCWDMKFTTQNAVFASSPIGLLTVGGMVDFAGTNTNNKPVLLPDDCRTVSRIYNPYYALYMNPISYEAYKYHPMQQPGNTFVISGEDSNGNLQAILFPSVNYVLTYSIDYTAVPNELVNDTDISIIPKEFRAVLKHKALMLLTALNYGIGVDSSMFETDYVRLLTRMNVSYLPYNDISMSVNIGGITDNNAPSRDYLNNTNVLNEYPNSWYENKGGTGRPGGGY